MSVCDRLHSRRVHVLGSTRHPDEAFVQTMRHLTDDVDRTLRGDCLLICHRDRKWSAAVERFLATASVRMICTPFVVPKTAFLMGQNGLPLSSWAGLSMILY